MIPKLRYRSVTTPTSHRSSKLTGLAGTTHPHNIDEFCHAVLLDKFQPQWNMFFPKDIPCSQSPHPVSCKAPVCHTASMISCGRRIGATCGASPRSPGTWISKGVANAWVSVKSVKGGIYLEKGLKYIINLKNSFSKIQETLRFMVTSKGSRFMPCKPLTQRWRSLSWVCSCTPFPPKELSPYMAFECIPSATLARLISQTSATEERPQPTIPGRKGVIKTMVNQMQRTCLYICMTVCLSGYQENKFFQTMPYYSWDAKVSICTLTHRKLIEPRRPIRKQETNSKTESHFVPHVHNVHISISSKLKVAILRTELNHIPNSSHSPCSLNSRFGRSIGTCVGGAAWDVLLYIYMLVSNVRKEWPIANVWGVSGLKK